MEPSPKPFDLEERTFLFAQSVRVLVKRLPRTLCNIEDCRQLVRSSGSVGANYIEAREPLGKKDYLMKLRTARKEAKESRYWLRLVETGVETETTQLRQVLVEEATELLRILSAMISR